MSGLSCGGDLPIGMGEPFGLDRRSPVATVHPHGRGGAAHVAVEKEEGRGPGSLPARAVCRTLPGSIPTGVGEPPRSSRRPCSWRVHPHGRGGAAVSFTGSITSWGPSPRAWGSRHLDHDGRAGAGSIPTGVGEPCPGGHNSRIHRVHPHGRGGAARIAMMPTVITGPSPRAWGSHRLTDRRQRAGGSIPTGVGEPINETDLHARHQVHPHGRGGANKTAGIPGSNQGPSPRAWGSPGSEPHDHVHAGSIPTGVGEPRLHQAADCGTRVHPHGRGGASARQAVDNIHYVQDPRVYCTELISR